MHIYIEQGQIKCFDFSFLGLGTISKIAFQSNISYFYDFQAACHLNIWHCLCVCVCNQPIFNQHRVTLCDVAQCRTTLYNIGRLNLVAPIDCWQNSYPFSCNVSFCITKVDNFITKTSRTTCTVSKLLQAFHCFKAILVWK